MSRPVDGSGEDTQDDGNVTEPEYRPRRSPLYSVLVIFVVMGGVIFASIMYTNRVAGDSNRRADQLIAESNRRFEQLIRESNQKWCGIIGTFDRAYRAQPPTTETGRLVASQMRQLSLDYGCK